VAQKQKATFGKSGAKTTFRKSGAKKLRPNLWVNFYKNITNFMDKV
jgi:hypothetical protein